MIRTILNEKGGVAKTITAVQLAAGFAKAGKQTLLIDGDPQSCATKLLFEEEDIRYMNMHCEKAYNLYVVSSLFGDPGLVGVAEIRCQ